MTVPSCFRSHGAARTGECARESSSDRSRRLPKVAKRLAYPQSEHAARFTGRGNRHTLSGNSSQG